MNDLPATRSPSRAPPGWPVLRDGINSIESPAHGASSSKTIATDRRLRTCVTIASLPVAWRITPLQPDVNLIMFPAAGEIRSHRFQLLFQRCHELLRSST